MSVFSIAHLLSHGKSEIGLALHHRREWVVGAGRVVIALSPPGALPLNEPRRRSLAAMGSEKYRLHSRRGGVSRGQR
jgi:hypothetical protein